MHMFGNLKLLIDFAEFDEYAHALRYFLYPILPPFFFLWVFSISLIVAVVVHIASAAMLTMAHYDATGRAGGWSIGVPLPLPVREAALPAGQVRRPHHDLGWHHHRHLPDLPPVAVHRPGDHCRLHRLGPAPRTRGHGLQSPGMRHGWGLRLQAGTIS